VPAARSHNRSFGIFGERSHPPYLEVDDAIAAVDIEEIVLTFAYMRHRVQQILDDLSAVTPADEKCFNFGRKPSLYRRHLSMSNIVHLPRS